MGEWTEEDEQFLRDNCDGMHRGELADHLGRTKSSITAKLWQMRLTAVRKPRSASKRWTEEERRFLRDNVGTMTNQEMADHLGRDVCSVSQELQISGLTRKALGLPMRAHGDKRTTPLYGVWESMRKRCNNPRCKSYSYYGGRGITVCPEWDDFPVFYQWAMENGYGPGLSLDRVDNDLGYNPSNCRWSTRHEQANNKRSNRILTVNGESKNIAEWTRDPRCSAGYHTIVSRLDRGWSDEDAVLFSTEMGYKRKKRPLSVQPGETYGALEVISVESKPSGRSVAAWCRCRCSCGRIVERWASPLKRAGDSVKCRH